MAIKKSQIYSSLWASCDALRGGMDASQYKNYILTLLFMKYVSDKSKNDPYSPIRVPQGGGRSAQRHIHLRPGKEWTAGVNTSGDCLLELYLSGRDRQPQLC